MESNGGTTSNAMEGAYADAKSLLEREERDVERAVSGITDVQVSKVCQKREHDVNY